VSVNREELKKQLIEELNLEELTVDDIADDAKLFDDDGIGLDSIDALELIVLLEKYYGVKLTNPDEGKEVLESISTMVNYIEENT